MRTHLKISEGLCEQIRDEDSKTAAVLIMNTFNSSICTASQRLIAYVVPSKLGNSRSSRQMAKKYDELRFQNRFWGEITGK